MAQTKKVVLTVGVIAILLIGSAAGLYLVRQKTNLFSGAKGKNLVCHIPPGNEDDAQKVEVNPVAWQNGTDPHSSHAFDYVITEELPCPPAFEERMFDETGSEEFPTGSEAEMSSSAPDATLSPEY